MMKEKFENGSEMFMLFQDYWELTRDLWNAENSEEYWERAIGKTDEFYKKYIGVKDYASGLVVTLMCELERKLKEKEGAA
jgi:hypothetical protein